MHLPPSPRHFSHCFFIRAEKCCKKHKEKYHEMGTSYSSPPQFCAKRQHLQLCSFMPTYFRAKTEILLCFSSVMVPIKETMHGGVLQPDFASEACGNSRRGGRPQECSFATGSSVGEDMKSMFTF